MTGYEKLRKSAAWIDESHRGRIRASGEDRARLLHAMSTNHVASLEPGCGLYTFFLNDKGRILADAAIYNLGESLFLDTEPEAGHKLFEHLDRFIIADDVTLEDESARFAVLTIAGPEALAIASRAGIPASATPDGVETLADGIGFSAHAAAVSAHDLRLFVPAAERDAWLARFRDAGLTEADQEAARAVRIGNAIPRYGEEITERYLVQETQIDRAVHANKGCYLGQEIVERVRSRGQVHRLLAPVQFATVEAPPPGTKIAAEGSSDGGEIVSAVFSPAAGEAIGFAYLRSEVIDKHLAMSISGTGDQPSVSIRSIRSAEP